jgi:hypothetical protein
MDGTEPIFELSDVEVTGGEPVLLGPEEGETLQVRRIDLRVSEQPVRLTQLVLFPPER